MFRWLWVASVASNVGTWIHEVGAGWLMTELNSSPTAVALVQAATTLPIFLLALPAGALADVVDRRRLLLVTQSVMVVLAGALAICSWQGLTGTSLLLVLTLGLGVFAAFSNPAWQTTMTDLVPREELPQASALNSVSINLSRAIGPAIGGVVVSAAGPWAAFALNAASFVGIIGVLWNWSYRAPHRAVPAERFVGAIKAGVRYVRYHPPMIAVLVRTASFVLFASALWALLPLVARQQYLLSSTGFGVLLGCLGAGAVSATTFVTRLRRVLSPNVLVAGATVGYAAAIALLGASTRPVVGGAALVIAGAGWLTVVTSLNVAAQSGTPPWVRARSLACYLSIFFGCMAIGSAVWGVVATQSSLSRSLLIASGGLLVGLFTLVRFRLIPITGEELAESKHWAEPVVADSINPDDGPVVITIEYRIRREDAEQFRVSMGPVARTRYRDGAIQWTLSRDTEDPERWLEVFIVESWAEHLRQHDRVTVGDQRVQEYAKGFHVGPDKPVVRHSIAAQVDHSVR